MFIDRATEYAHKVVSGEVVAGELHILACQRHLRDLERQNTDEFPYYYDIAKANEIIEFAETLTIAEGFEPKPVKLIDSQVFDLSCTFGWCNCKDGYRRFRQRYKSMSRQNGKTFENGIMMAYIAAFSGYKYGKLFTAATKKDQAKLVWDEMAKFIEVDEDLGDLFKVQEYKNTIECKDTKCVIKVLSREGGLSEGFRSIFISLDEIHQHKDDKTYTNLSKGTRSLKETLISMITTRGDNPNSFCKEMDDYAVNILKGVFTDEKFFADIYALDKDDDIWDPANYAKANPFICAEGNEGLFEIFLEDAQRAKNMGGAVLKSFMSRDLNMWVTNYGDMYIDLDKWVKCGTDKTLEDFRGQQCWVGLDLSSSGDLTTLALEFVNDGKYYFYSHSFMPRGKMEEHIKSDFAPYDIWEMNGLITVTGGDMDFRNDYKFIISTLKEIREKYDLKFLGIGLDPFNAEGIKADLEDLGVPVVIVQQTAKSLNTATEDLRLLVKSEDVEYDKKNELLSWSFANAVTTKNSMDEVKISKRAGYKGNRIDPVDACVDAHYLAVKNRVVDHEQEMENYFELMGW